MRNLKTAIQSFAEALLLPINPAVVVLLGLYTVIWGLWVINPWWTVFTQANLYSTLCQVAPNFLPAEVFWGGIAIVCGVLTIYGAVRRSYYSLLLGAASMGWHWFMISIFYFIADSASTGGITALFISIYGVFLYLNIKVNFKENKDIDEVLRKIKT